jgi:hypothetical protein
VPDQPAGEGRRRALKPADILCPFSPAASLLLRGEALQTGARSVAFLVAARRGTPRLLSRHGRRDTRPRRSVRGRLLSPFHSGYTCARIPSMRARPRVARLPLPLPHDRSPELPQRGRSPHSDETSRQVKSHVAHGRDEGKKPSWIRVYVDGIGHAFLRVRGIRRGHRARSVPPAPFRGWTLFSRPFLAPVEAGADCGTMPAGPD